MTGVKVKAADGNARFFEADGFQLSATGDLALFESLKVAANGAAGPQLRTTHVFAAGKWSEAWIVSPSEGAENVVEVVESKHGH